MRVLEEAGKPLTVDQITQEAVRGGYLVHAGETPTNSMRARISEDIRRRRFHSRFQRTGPGRFALRSDEFPEYVAPPLARGIPDEVVTCVPRDRIPTGVIASFGLLEAIDLSDWLNQQSVVFEERPRAETLDHLKQLVAYVILRHPNGSILTYRRGHLSSAHPMLRGARCLGFGGHVQAIDTQDLFGIGDAGIVNTATRELYEELSGLSHLKLKTIGLISDESSLEGLRHLGVVLEGELPEGFTEERSRRERAINDLKLRRPEEIAQSWHEYEFWSQLLIRDVVAPGHMLPGCLLRPRRRPVRTQVLAVVGEIASGKTTLCELVTERLHFGRVSTRQCLLPLINQEDFGTAGRTDFQRAAQKFISSTSGPRRLADAIAKSVRAQTLPCLVDGIRQHATLTELRAQFPDLTVVYVDSSRDHAYRNFTTRSEHQATLAEFREARSHPVEEEVASLRLEADAYLYNAGTIDELFSTFTEWWASPSG
ncbi:MAG: hypothetical protein IV100_19495 [Myxococcales bacterium]|nr:hypothetical protein [Myxococcales bacterium]